MNDAIQTDTSRIKSEIIKALKHPEAEEGLYFRNFYYLHEEDDRNPVPGTQEQILEALRELIAEGQVETDESGEDVVFYLASAEHAAADA